MKLMIWWFLMSSILIANVFGMLIKKYQSWNWKRILSTGLISVILIFSTVAGVVSVYRESYTSWQLFSNEGIALAKFVVVNTPKDAIFLTSDEHNNPIPCLTGRQIIMGYRGWLWTWGVDYKKRESDVVNIFSGSSSAINLINKYNIQYVVLDKFMNASFNVSDDFFAKNFTLVYKSENFWVYKTGL